MVHVNEDIEANTTPYYRSPEQLDFYSNFPINEKVDIFALGVLLFMICYQKPPFESRMAAIQKQYFLPEHNLFSSRIV